MAENFIKKLELLHDDEAEEKCEKLMEEIKHILKSSELSTPATALSAFIKKALLFVTETKILSVCTALLPAAEEACKNMLLSLKAWENASQVSKLLQVSTELLETMSACCQWAEERSLQQVQFLDGLLSPAFQCIKATYSHCQESSQLYGSMLESVNGPLTRLFRAATSLQSGLHQLADAVVSADSSHQDQQAVTLLTTVCDDVAETGRQLTQLDTRAMAEAWKCYLRLLQRLPDLLPPAVRLGDALTYMAAEVASQLATVRERGRDKTFAPSSDKRLARAVKMCSFYLKLVVGLSESYVSSVGGALTSLVRLVLTLIRFSAPDSHVADVDPSVLGQLSSQLTVAAEPLLDCLMEHQGFPQSFWSALSDSEDLGGLCRLRCCLILIRRTCHLAAPARASWTSEGVGERHLIAAVLRLMPLCDRELTCCLQLDCDGQGRTSGSLSAAELRAAELHLWRHLCRGDGWASLLAADTLCFIARYGPAALCRSYCDAAAGALSRRRCPPLRRLLCRLVPLLAAEDRDQLLRRPAAACLLHPACPPALLESALTAAEEGTEQLTGRPGRRTAAQVTALSDSLFACGTALSAPPTAAGLPSRLLTLLERLWAAVPTRLTGPAGSRLACGLLRASAALPADSPLSDQQLTQVLSICSGWLPECSVPVKLGVIGLLGSIKARQFPSVKDDGPKHYIPTLYRSLLTDPSQLVRQRAMDAFAAFASRTPHAALISAAVAAPAGLQGTASGHLQRLAARRRGPAALSAALARAGVSSAAAAAVPEILPRVGPLTDSEGAGGGGEGPMDSEDGLPVTDGPAARLTNGTGGDGSGRSPPGEGSLPPREAQLLDGIQRRLAALRRDWRQGGAAADGGRLLRLLTDIQTRLDAG
ncbi:uncharacterized protein FJT64_013905 [Amphibalanus amphitrite]|uniref:Uncharacterized protein n=1 Tax=Amphibalanus amphitrite TaxID=1232801 RepID=A0A6A4V1A9_AMPAM|nr:uncharacterized protein FJT64_013905 [Amphibalanus amphitrite]